MDVIREMGGWRIELKGHITCKVNRLGLVFDHTYNPSPEVFRSAGPIIYITSS